MRVKLIERERDVCLEIPNFKALVRGARESAVVSYGASPFLVSGRKWGINVYPSGHCDGRKIGSRIDVYVFIHAKDSWEAEQDFLAWIRAKNIHFNITLTEPAPQSLHVKYSSSSHWSDLEDGAGWWYFSLEVPSPLLELTNDTLVVRLSFNQNSPPASTPVVSTETSGLLLNPLALMAKPAKPVDLRSIYPLFPSVSYDPALETLFDNCSISDFRFLVQSEKIHVQKCFLMARLPSWIPPVASNTDNECLARNTDGKRKNEERITGVNYIVAKSFFNFVYSGRLPILETNSCAENVYLGELIIMCDRFGHNDLKRYVSRRLFGMLTVANVLELLVCGVGKSKALQELAIFFICQNFKSIRNTDPFRALLAGCASNSADRQTAQMSKQLLSILRRLKTSKKSSGVVEQMDSSLTVKNGKLSKDIVADMPLDKNGNLAKLAPSSVTPRRSKAFRTLLTNSSVSDVHFVIEGKTIYGQKCVLASLSEFFNAMFTGAWSESVTETTTVVEIVDFNFTTFSAMLEYLVILKHNQTEPDLFLQYLEEIDYNATLIDLGLLHLCADKYQILDLVDKTTSLISSKFSIHNISEFLFGFAYQNDDLYSLALDYFLSNFDEIRVCSEFATVIRKSWMYADSFVEILEEVFLNIVVEGFDHVEFIPEEMGDDDEGVSSDCGSQLDDCPISATTESTYACENIHTSPSVGYRSENEEFLDPVFSGDLGDDRPGFQTLDLELSSFLSNTVNSA